MAAQAPPTLLIGLDGATFDVLQPLWEDGSMPFLAQAVTDGVRADLITVVPHLTPPAWTSLVTGRSPGHHGIFDFVRISRRVDEEEDLVSRRQGNGAACAGSTGTSTQERGPALSYRMATSTDVRCETLWSILSRSGRRLATLNFPVGIPPQPVAGYWIAGFAPWRHLRRAVYPPQLFDALVRLPGLDRRELALDIERERRAIQVLDKAQYEEWIELHIRREEQWLEVLRHLLRTERCDLMAVLFDGMDKLQHLCWRFIDPAMRAADASPWERRVTDRCLAYFRRVDEIIAEAVTLMGPRARVFIVSDHGFGPTTNLFYVNAWLASAGYLRWARSIDYDHEDRVAMLESTRSSAALFDWDATTACALTSGSNGIYINVAAGPGAAGVPADAYYRFRALLRDRLLAVADPATGEPVVSRVLTREEAFAGPQMHRAPDLTLQLHDGGFVSILNAEQPVKRRREVVGTHRRNGIFIAFGPGVRQGATIGPLSILDVAPSLLYNMGLPVPCDLEGCVPEGLFDEAVLKGQPLRVGPPTVAPSPSGPDDEFGAADDAQIVRRLKALGYLE